VDRNFDYRRDDYDFDFACNNGLIMAGARVYTMAKDGVLRKLRYRTKLVFLLGLMGAMFLGFGFGLTGKYGDLLDFCSYYRFDTLLPFGNIHPSEKCQMLKDL
jgi:hypothetical protein